MPKFPKMSPILILVVTIVLAVVTGLSVFILYQNRSTPVSPTAPLPSHASTTQTISDSFDAALPIDSDKWTLGGSSSGTVAGITPDGKLGIDLVQQGSSLFYFLRTKQQITGDFEAEVDLNTVVSTGAGTAGLNFAAPDGSTIARISRTNGNTLEGAVGSATPTTISLPSGNTTVRVKMQRIADFFQLFYSTDNGTTFNLMASANDSTNDGHLLLFTSNYTPFASVQTTYDNFASQVNLSNAPTPVPGTAAACMVSFTVLDTVATPTAGPSATPSPTVTPGPSATPSPTVTPGPSATPGPSTTPNPNSCGGTCGSNANCDSSHICVNGFCRNPQCTASTNCVCAGTTTTTTPTPTSPIVAGVSPTPVILQTAGSVNGTWILGLGGAVILGLGAILLFAL